MLIYLFYCSANFKPFIYGLGGKCVLTKTGCVFILHTAEPGTYMGLYKNKGDTLGKH